MSGQLYKKNIFRAFASANLSIKSSELTSSAVSYLIKNNARSLKRPSNDNV